MTPTGPGFPGFDPSKLDPKVLMRLSQLVQGLPPDQLGRMQTLMHNMMAGYDVRREMEEFEKTLPPGFREELMTMMGGSAGPAAPMGGAAGISADTLGDAEGGSAPEMDVREARLTLLRAVAEGRLSPDEAERLLFPGT